jgi:hypothetical protein
MKILHSNHEIYPYTETKIINNTIVSKTNEVLLKLVCLPINKKYYGISCIQNDNQLNIFLEIFIDDYYKSNIKLDTNLIYLLKTTYTPTINNNSTNIPKIKTYKFYTNNIIEYDNYYIDLSSKIIKKKLTETDYINVKINGYIVNGIKKIYFFKGTLEKYKKILVLCSNKKITQNLENVFQKLNVSYNNENTSIKWDCIINFENTVNIKDYNYKTHIYVCDTINANNYQEIFRNFIGIPNINYENKHNIDILNQFITQNNQSKTIKVKNFALTKYETKFKIGINKNKMDSFYSYPGNYIFNKFLTKSEFNSNHGNIIRTCSICLDNIELNKITITNCNHVYCKGCILKNMQLSNKCPLCRQKIKKNSLSFVSKFKYTNNKLNYINSRLNNNKSLLLLSSFHDSINNLKTVFKEEIKNKKLELIHVSKLNFIKKQFNEILLLDNTYEHLDFIIDIYMNKNKNTNITLLSYDVK